MSSSNQKGDVKINDLELGALLTQLIPFSLGMVPLAHIHTYVDKKITGTGHPSQRTHSLSSIAHPVIDSLGYEVSEYPRLRRTRTGRGEKYD